MGTEKTSGFDRHQIVPGAMVQKSLSALKTATLP